MSVLADLTVKKQLLEIELDDLQSQVDKYGDIIVSAKLSEIRKKIKELHEAMKSAMKNCK
jgi:hypothetical protein